MHPAEIAKASFQEYEKLTACPVCGSVKINTAFEPDVARCASCRVFFRNPRPTQAEIQRSYDVGANYAEWQQSATDRGLMWKRRLELIIPFKQCGRLLDIGAGDGHFLDIAKAAGFETYGTELSLTGAEYAEGRGHHLLIGQLKEIGFDGLKFDMVTIWHVLEHVPNPGEALEIVSSLLKPDGILALAVPNEENQLFRYRLRAGRGRNPLGSLVWSKEIHLTHFQPATLRRALYGAGLVPIRFGVDDIYSDRSIKNMAKLWMQKSLAATLQWHFSMAMYYICRKRS
jgi:SAM-dependent methyltransferase